MAALFGDLDDEKQLIRMQVAARLEKVGPKGYIHGWIFVGHGTGAVGDKVSHPDHGAGKITSIDNDGVHAEFDDGTSGVLGSRAAEPAASSGFRKIEGSDAELNDATGEVRDSKTGEIAGTLKPDEYDARRYAVDGNGWTSYASYNSPELAASKAVAGYRYSKEPPAPVKPAETKARMLKRLSGTVPKGALSGDKLWESDEGKLKLDPKEAKSAGKAWFKPGYELTSDAMRNGTKLSPSRQAGVDALRDITHRAVLKHDIYTHRGVAGTTDLFGQVGEKIGQTFSDKSFTASSTDPLVAYGYSKNNEEEALVHIHTPAGMSAFRGDESVYGTTVNMLSQHEYVLPADTQFKVTGDKLDSTGMRHIYLTVTGQPRS
jgi:hypothetical protein